MSRIIIENKNGERASVRGKECGLCSSTNAMDKLCERTWGVRGAKSLHKLNLVTIPKDTSWKDVSTSPEIHCLADAVGFMGAYCVIWQVHNDEPEWVCECFKTSDEANQYVMRLKNALSNSDYVYVFHDWAFTRVKCDSESEPEEVRADIIVDVMLAKDYCAGRMAVDLGDDWDLPPSVDASMDDVSEAMSGSDSECITFEDYIDDDIARMKIDFSPKVLECMSMVRNLSWVDDPWDMPYTTWIMFFLTV